MTKMTNQDIASLVEDEGLGYVIQLHLSGNNFEDEELKKLWQECSKLMDKILDILRPYME